jgi:hypothetical protein
VEAGNKVAAVELAKIVEGADEKIRIAEAGIPLSGAFLQLGKCYLENNPDLAYEYSRDGILASVSPSDGAGPAQDDLLTLILAREVSGLTDFESKRKELISFMTDPEENSFSKDPEILEDIRGEDVDDAPQTTVPVDASAILAVLEEQRPSKRDRDRVLPAFQELAQRDSEKALRFFYGLVLSGHAHFWGLSFDVERAEQLWTSVAIRDVRELNTEDKFFMNAQSFFLRQKVRTPVIEEEVSAALACYRTVLRSAQTDDPSNVLVLCFAQSHPEYHE